MYRGGTRNRKRKSWEVEDVPMVVQEQSSEGKAMEGLEKIVWRCHHIEEFLIVHVLRA